MKILVIGSGGREHAILWKLAQSSRNPQLYCAPGNAGIARIAQCVPIAADAVEQLADFAEQTGIDLTIIGPEVALLAGAADEFAVRGLPVFGPKRQAALIEGSKAFAKEMMQALDIPTARYGTFTELAPALEFINKFGAPIVVKADGLAAGKGVVVARTIADAEAAVHAMLGDGFYGTAGSQLVIEEFLTGEEATVMAFVDGSTIRLMMPAQDHKQIYDRDQGPNTGGMGTYAPVPSVTPELLQEVEARIFRPLVDALANRGTPYQGVLYAGLMLTAEGPKVIEFNARFGDPETQVVLPLLQTDLIDIVEAVIDGNLQDVELFWQQSAAVCVILAAAGYPGPYSTGDPIHGLTDAQGTVVFHAGTALQDTQFVTNGGRVLGVTGVGENLASAKEAAYQGVTEITFTGMQYRTDIGAKGLPS